MLFRSKILEFSSESDQAREDVISAIHALVDDVQTHSPGSHRPLDKPFKLSIDRVFSMKGFGTVVTGTTASGSLGVGDVVRLVPQEELTRVRGIQVHGESVDRVLAGARAAINLQGIEHHHVSRSEVLTSEDGFDVIQSFDGTLHALKRLAKPIKNRSKVLVQIGRAHV